MIINTNVMIDTEEISSKTDSSNPSFVLWPHKVKPVLGVFWQKGQNMMVDDHLFLPFLSCDIIGLPICYLLKSCQHEKLHIMAA